MSAKKEPLDKIGNITPFGLRMLPQLRTRLEESSRAAGRSLNAEIVARLEASLPQPGSDEMSGDEARVFVEAVFKMMDQYRPKAAKAE